MFWAGAKPEPEPLFETVRHPDLNAFYDKCFVFSKIFKYIF